MEKSVNAAESAYQNQWSKIGASDRVTVLYDMAEILGGRADEIAELETRENGKPLAESERDVEAAIEALRFYAGAADKNYGKTLPDRGDIMDMTVREPYGIVGAIIPWNWPPMRVCDFLAPVLASGNTLVLKPAPETPLCALRMAELFDDAVPDGVFNVVIGGSEAGEALAGNPTVGKLAFTGNTETGTKVLESAA